MNLATSWQPLFLVLLAPFALASTKAPPSSSSREISPLLRPTSGRPRMTVPVLFRSERHFYINRFGNCPGNFLSYVSDDGIDVDGLDECLRRCSDLTACRSVAVRMRDLPVVSTPDGTRTGDSVDHCWLKTVNECHSDFIPIGKKIEATMLVKGEQKPLAVSIEMAFTNPWQSSYAKCSFVGLPPVKPSTIRMEISNLDSSSPFVLDILNITRLNVSSYVATSLVPGLPHDSVKRLSCFGANLDGETVRRYIDVRPLRLPVFTSLKIFYDEVTNSSAKIRWSRWNAAVDKGEPPVIGYRIFVKALDTSFDVSPPSPSDIAINETFQAFISDRSCGSLSSCQFRLRGLEENGQYLIGVMPIRTDLGGDNGTVTWATRPLATLCGRPGAIDSLSTFVVWRNGSPKIKASFRPPSTDACGNIGRFVIRYTEPESPLSQRLIVSGEKRSAFIDQLKSNAHYAINVTYQNSQGDEGDAAEVVVVTRVPLEIMVLATTGNSITIGWEISSDLLESSETPGHYEVVYWLDSARLQRGHEVVIKTAIVNSSSACNMSPLLHCAVRITDLQANSPYYFSVVAFTSEEKSEEMYRSKTLTVTTTCDVPPIPANITVAKQSKSLLTFQWTVDGDLFCPLKSIQIDLSTDHLHRMIDVDDPTAMVHELRVAELSDLLARSNKIKAKARSINVRGLYSDWSEPTVIVILSPIVRPTPVIARSSATALPSFRASVPPVVKSALNERFFASSVPPLHLTKALPTTAVNKKRTQADGDKDHDLDSSQKAIIVGAVVACVCVATMLAMLCIIILKKKKPLVIRNKVSRFASSPVTGSSPDSSSITACPGPAEYFMKHHPDPAALATHCNPSEMIRTANNQLGKCLPDVAVIRAQHHCFTASMAAAGLPTPPTDSTPASDADLDNQLVSQPGTLKMQAGNPNATCTISTAWSSPALQSAGSAINKSASSTSAIRIDRLKQAIIERKADDLALYRKEFASFVRKPDKPQEIGKAKENNTKNRYRDVFPYDFNCVLLDDDHNAKEPIYINASYVKGASGEREYVAAQGPSPTTAPDFWKMIWQLNINRVVMLTNTNEKGKVKCHRYWPDPQNVIVFDNISVETLNEQQFTHFVRRTFRVRMRQLTERTETCSRVVTQFQFTNWLDHRVVRFATPIITFMRKINKNFANHHRSAANQDIETDYVVASVGNCSSSRALANGSLMLVHCSAGIGRTGTFIAADIAIKRAEAALVKRSPHDVEVDLRATVADLRDQRHKMVQNLEQYMFLYDVVYETLSTFSVKPTAMPLSMTVIISPAKMQREFEVLERTKPVISRLEFDIAMDIKNAGKNRVQRILPASFCRVQLLTPSDDKQDYISAIWIDGFQRPRSLIAAQTPMPHTVVDFWSVVWDWNVAAIVSLDPQPCLDPTYCAIGPGEEAEAVFHGPFKVKSLRRTAVSSHTNEETSRPYVVDVLSVSNSHRKGESCREVRHFEYTGAWLPTARGVPTSVDQFSEFIIGIDETRKAAQGRPIIVHCLDSATRTGLTLLTILLKEECDCDEEVDIFTMLKMIRNSRPEFVQSLEQYSFAYTFVRHVLNSSACS